MSEIDEWGSIPLTKIKERTYDKYIVVDDVDSFNKMNQHVVKYVGRDGDYIIVESDGHKGRMQSLIYQKLKRKPVAFVNDQVRDLFWHNNRAAICLP